MNILLMTSTIRPQPGTFLLSVDEEAERLKHYCEALHFYLERLREGVFDRIVYADNSGQPLDALLEIANKADVGDSVEFLSFEQSTPPLNSRYYLEMHLIDEALRRSILLSKSEDRIWKVSGRYIVENAAEIVSSFPDDADLYINFRNMPYSTLDFYFFGFRLGSYTRHIGRDLEFYCGTEAGEDLLRRRVDAGDFADAAIVRRFWRPARLRGVRGYDGSRYGGGKDAIKYALRRAASVVAPWVWI